MLSVMAGSGHVGGRDEGCPAVGDSALGVHSRVGAGGGDASTLEDGALLAALRRLRRWYDAEVAPS